MILKRIAYPLVTAFVMFITTNAVAQNVEEDETIVSTKGYTRYFGFGAGAAYRSFVDEVMSPIAYSKIGATASIANIKTNETKYVELYFQGSYMEMNRPSEALVKARTKSINGLMDYRYMYKLAVPFLNDGIYDVRAGGMLSTQFSLKDAEHLGNSSKVNEYAASLGVTAKIARQQFTNDRKTYLIWELSIPFIASLSRPGYMNQPTSLSNDRTAIENLFENNAVGTFGKYLRLNSRVSYMYSIKNGNKLRLTYQWDYNKMKGVSGKVYTVEHSLILTYMFNY
jgi:hypothetical protein